MKKILNFDKEINFPTMIGEITSISLDHTLKFTSANDIEGSFFIKGSYKMTEASHIEEEFDYNIPISIAITENLDLNTCKVEIEDFYYEILNDDTLKCEIEVLVEGVEEIILEDEPKEIDEIEVLKEEFVEKEEVLVRECDGDEKEEEDKEVPKRKEVTNEEKEEKMENIEVMPEIDEKEKKKLEKENLMPQMKPEMSNEKQEEMPITDKNIESIFSAFKDTDETFVPYSVYILRKNDTLEKVFDLYNTNKEELSNYNDLENLSVGSKIIIPNEKQKVNE